MLFPTELTDLPADTTAVAIADKVTTGAHSGLTDCKYASMNSRFDAAFLNSVLAHCGSQPIVILLCLYDAVGLRWPASAMPTFPSFSLLVLRWRPHP
ncbi:hypothetical protein Y032_0111g228 [Ancylostoma ceylanicum]|uniref:Uncharacterized protein n=1 Tax=Ancylostoma ceylanicum TaxID=53326 RepID=A0A016TEA7_9BILA|nr:hypothetical protein Y032_0111g228 [Ancylostoma ceylanicum]